MLFRRLNWNIVGWFRVVSTISYLIIALGAGSMIYHGFQGGQGFQASHMLRLGLSFTGGTDIDVQFTQPTTSDKVKAALAGFGLTDESVTTAGTSGKGFVVQTQTSFANDSAPLWKALGTVAPVDRAASQITAVGPSLGREYLTRALWALVIALGIQFLYIAFRFGWNYIFGLVTVIALVRDAAMMIGIYALADKRADDAFLAAVLTVIGYSVMDTIVILDRIRENTKLMAGKAVRLHRQRVDQTDDDAFVQHLGDGRHHAGRAARIGRRQFEELRVRAARRHLLRRLPLDLLLRAAGAGFPQAADGSRGQTPRCCARTEPNGHRAQPRGRHRAAKPCRRAA